MNCTECGGFVPIRPIRTGEESPPQLNGAAHCVRCDALNDLANASLFVIDGQRLRRIRLSSPIDYVK